MKNKLFEKALCYSLCGAMLLSSPGIATFADNPKSDKNISNSAIGVYITTTPKVMVGENARASISGIYTPYMIDNYNIKWYRTNTGDVNDGVIIPDAISSCYTYTEEDIGYYVYAVISGVGYNNENFSLITNLTDKPVSKYVAEVENWFKSSDGMWQYDILDGTDNLQIKITEESKQETKIDLKGLNVIIPSSIDGHKVTKLADNCFEGACIHNPGSGSDSFTYMASLTLPNTIEELGSNLMINPKNNINLVLPESVKYVEDNAFNSTFIYGYNEGSQLSYRLCSRIIVNNPICHFEAVPAVADSGMKDTVWYVGAFGGSLHNIYGSEERVWYDNGLASAGLERYKFEKLGVYNSSSNNLNLSEKEKIQQNLDSNEKDWKLTPDGKFYYDTIDGTDKLVLKPAEVTDNININIKIPSTIENIGDVAAVELDTIGVKNTIIDIPPDVIIDKNSSSLSDSTILSGNAGSDAEEYSKDKDLVFENKDNEISTKTEYDDASKSIWFQSEDGYWQYRFIDGYNGVEIQNIKSFGDNIEVEVPSIIDGHKTSAFNGLLPKGTYYDNIILPDSINVMSNAINAPRAGNELGAIVGTKNLTVYNKNADVSVLIESENIQYQPTNLIGYTGSTADLICIHRIDGETNKTGILEKTIFIPLDVSLSLNDILITGSPKEGQTLIANLTPNSATVNYKWMVSENAINFTEIENTDSKSFIVPSGYLGKYIKVKAEGIKNYSGIIESSVIQIVGDEATELSRISISNAAQTGFEINSYISPYGATANYQWYRDTNSSTELRLTNGLNSLPVTAEKIDGATNSSYTPTESDVGKYLFVVASGTGDYYGQVKSQSSEKIKGLLSKATITGYTYVNQTIVAEVLEPEGAKEDTELNYEWYYGTTDNVNVGRQISGATSKEFTITDEYLNNYIYCEIYGSDNSTYGGLVKTNAVKVTELTNCEDAGLEHQPGEWIVKKAPTCTEKGLEVKRCDICGKEIETREISATGHHYELVDDKYICTNEQQPDIINDTDYPWTKDENNIWKSNVEGISNVETSLTYKFSLSNTTDISFDWMSNSESNFDYIYYTLKKDGNIVSGTGDVTESSYKGLAQTYYSSITEIKDADWQHTNMSLEAGSYELIFTYTKDSGGNKGLDAGFVKDVNIPLVCGDEKQLLNIESLALTGDLIVGKTLEANLQPTDATANYEWFIGESADTTVWTKIEGASTNSYKLTENEVDKFIKAVATGTGEYEGQKEAITNSTVQEETIISDKLEKVIVSGSTKVGNELQANVYPSNIDADIRWLASESLDGDYVEIGTGNTYKLTENEIGKYIKAEATNNNDNNDVVLSSATSIIKENNSDDTDEYNKIIDSQEEVDYIQEDLTEDAFVGTQERDVLVYASQGQSFKVSIPKRISFDGSSSSTSVDFETKVFANISGNDVITVEPEIESFSMSEEAGIKKDITCNLLVGQTKFSIAEDSQESLETGKVATHTVSVENLTAGSWRGTFNWLIKVRGQKNSDSQADTN